MGANTKAKKEKNVRDYTKAKAPTKAKSRGSKDDRHPAKAKRRDDDDDDDASAKVTSSSSPQMPLELLQLLANVFKDSFPSVFSTNLQGLLQEIKGHLYNRDFELAFGKDDYLQAYSIRWSSSRALAYSLIFREVIGKYLTDRSSLASPSQCDDETKSPPDANLERLGMVCLGGGAGAEIVGLAGYQSHMHSLLKATEGTEPDANADADADASPSTSCDTPSAIQCSGSVQSPQLNIKAIDIANWTDILSTLHRTITTPPPPSKYAPASARPAANTPLLPPEEISVSFHQHDLLDLELATLTSLLEGARLVTLMYTLNELYSASMTKTTNLLLSLTYLLEPGTLLLVVDSPGSYSTVAVGTGLREKPAATESTSQAPEEKKYPMHWLLDHTLLSASSVGSSKNAQGQSQWEKLESIESRWFRLPEGLRYPIELENMRYQLHLYRRV
ncbi:MAG: hypothetical protein M1819_002603 [Sarea resinae]|nr:MAG: hypothetical protein M1819_002603 [Sarea resinae]